MAGLLHELHIYYRWNEFTYVSCGLLLNSVIFSFHCESNSNTNMTSLIKLWLISFCQSEYVKVACRFNILLNVFHLNDVFLRHAASERTRASTHSPCQGENFLFKTECWVEWCCYCFNFCLGCRQCVVSYNSQRKCDNRRCTYWHLRHYPCVHLHVSLAIITRNHVDTSLAKVLNKSYQFFSFCRPLHIKSFFKLLQKLIRLR